MTSLSEPPAQASGGAQRDLAVDLPVVQGARGLRVHGRGEAGGVADGEDVEDQVVVVALERRGRRQDHVRVPGGLVDVDVHGRHEVEAGQGPAESLAVGGRRHRVAGHGQGRADLAVARSEDLVGQGRDGELAAELGEVAHPAAPAVPVAAAHERAADDIDGRPRQHGAARPVQVAGQQVQQLDRPLAHQAVRLDRGSHPGVDGGRVRGGELVGEPTHVLGRDTAGLGGTLARERVDEAPYLLQPVDVLRHPGQAVLEQGPHHREQEVRIGARSHEQVLVGDARGLGPARVDHDQPPATVVQVPHPAGEVRDGHQAAVGRHRVGAHEQQVGGPVDVGHRQQQLVAVEQVRHDLVGELVDRGGAVHVARPEGADHRTGMGHRPEAVHVRVAEVDADRVATVLGDRASQAVGDEVERLVPAELLPALGGTADGSAQPVGVVLDVGQREGLGADVAAREGVVGVAAYRGHPAVLDGEPQPADRLAEVADAEPFGLRVPAARHGPHPVTVRVADRDSEKRRGR